MLLKFSNYIVTDLFKLDLSTRMGDSVNFFIYDTLKILLLLTVMIFTISFIRSYFPPEKVKQILSRFNGFIAHFMASILGVLSPF